MSQPQPLRETQVPQDVFATEEERKLYESEQSKK